MGTNWLTSSDDLRRLLSDGPTDRIAARKSLVGELNSVNTLFKTFEFRRITDFTASTSPLGLFLNGVLLANADVASDDVATGFFSLVVAPSDGDRLEANYYYQWFLDTEIADFILKAVNWLGILDPTDLQFGLQDCALHHAAAQAYLKQASRWRLSMSSDYRMEDTPDPKQKTPTDEYRALSSDMMKQATALRDQFYTRQGRSLQPLFGAALGRARDITPRG